MEWDVDIYVIWKPMPEYLGVEMTQKKRWKQKKRIFIFSFHWTNIKNISFLVVKTYKVFYYPSVSFIFFFSFLPRLEIEDVKGRNRSRRTDVQAFVRAFSSLFFLSSNHVVCCNST